MVNLGQAILSVFSFGHGLHSPSSQTPSPTDNASGATKSIAIVGAGSAGLAMLHTIFELPVEIRQAWQVELFEQGPDVGGIWLREVDKPQAPFVPRTPLYPLLRTNTPVPTMTYPHHPFPPGTPLFPPAADIQRYHSNYSRTFGLDEHIAFNHTILSAAWIGNSTVGKWNLTVRDALNQTREREFDHLVVAGGNNHYPHIAHFDGEDEWVKADPERDIQHSVWYAGAQRYTNRTVLVIGSGASGQDIGRQILTTARKVYISARSDPIFNTDPNPAIIDKPAISHLTARSIVFVDGSRADDVDSIILATGYELRFPFLEVGKSLAIDRSARTNFSAEYHQLLTSNTRYLFPLHRHIVSLSPRYPLGSLLFIGLPIIVPNCFSDTAQSIFATQIIRNSTLLPSRKSMLRELREQEQNVRNGGWDPYVIGHRMMNGSADAYQDGLVQYLRDKGVVEDTGRPFTDPWRKTSGLNRLLKEYGLLKRGWARVEALKEVDEWLAGVETEEEWADLMERVKDWERKREEEEGSWLEHEDDDQRLAEYYWDDGYGYY